MFKMGKWDRVHEIFSSNSGQNCTSDRFHILTVKESSKHDTSLEKEKQP